MINHLNGSFIEVTPTHAVVECQGIGYHVFISLQTYDLIQSWKQGKLLVHPIIREDAHQLYGFAEEGEREMFRLLIGVSGVGAATARMILSASSVTDLQHTIMREDVASLKRIKGIGARSAERIIVDLKDKVGKVVSADLSGMSGHADAPVRQEATLALLALGFTRATIEKALDRVSKESPGNEPVETWIRKALNFL
jgi:Holliday junction DNA helicase RuvA